MSLNACVCYFGGIIACRIRVFHDCWTFRCFVYIVLGICIDFGTTSYNICVSLKAVARPGFLKWVGSAKGVGV